MNKYIDADRLLAEIERLYYNESEKDESILAADAYKNALDAIEKVIDSLQQEQPDKDKKTFDDYLKASPSERRKMNMTEILGEEKLAETKKQMEQPEVNFEKELEEEIERFYRTDEYRIADTLGRGFETLARHFYELGRNQVLQELYKGKIKPFDKIAVAWLDDE